MGKKTTKSVDKLRSDVQALSEAVWALKEHVRVEVAAESAANGSRMQKSRQLTKLEQQADIDSVRGVVSSYGSYVVADRSGADEKKVQWQLENVATESLIPDDLDDAAQRLGAIGHRQRLAILIALLEQPQSANDLVSTLELGTTGAAYHHLNVLQSAGFVIQEERGTYELAPHQISSIVGILTALAASPSVDVINHQPDGSPDSERAKAASG